MKNARKTTNFKHPENPNRQKAKLNRNKGKKAMEKANMDAASWSRNFDPLYGIKGMKRHKIVNNIK